MSIEARLDRKNELLEASSTQRDAKWAVPDDYSYSEFKLSYYQLTMVVDQCYEDVLANSVAIKARLRINSGLWKAILTLRLAKILMLSNKDNRVMLRGYPVLRAIDPENLIFSLFRCWKNNNSLITTHTHIDITPTRK